MTKPINEKQQLFRSLAADKSKAQTRSRTAAREAEERWPLFKAVAPALPSTLPALGEDDKRHWHREGKLEANPRPPSLSVPDMSAKLALGLSRMGASRQSTPAPRVVATAPSPVATLPAGDTALPSTTLPGLAVHASPPAGGAAAPLFARRTAALLPEPVARPAPAAGLFAHLAAGAPPLPAAPPEAAPADRSLAAIFNRLAPKPAPEPPAAPRASFLGRLGRR